MDSRSTCDKVSEELTRELLIAISYSVPEKVFDFNLPSENCSPVDGLVMANGDPVAEKYRSELISISYVEAPDL